MKSIFFSFFLLLNILGFGQIIKVVPKDTLTWQFSTSGSYMIKDPKLDFSPRGGYGFSALRLWEFQNRNQLLIGLSYQRLNFFCPYFPNGRNSSYKNIDFHWIDLSLPFQFRVFLGKDSPLFLEWGLAFNFSRLIGTGTQSNYPPSPVYAGSQRELTEGWGAYPNFSGMAGLGLEIPYKSVRFVVSSSFNTGLLILGSNPNHDNYNLGSFHRFLNLKAGVILDLRLPQVENK